MIVLAIDPGTTGAVAVIDAAGRAAVADLPTLAIARRTKGSRLALRIDAVGLHALIGSLLPPGSEPAVVIIEDVQPVPLRGTRGVTGASQSSNGSMMRSKGTIEAVCALHARCRDPIWLSPRTWKAHYDLKGGHEAKAASLALARRLYPDAQLPRAKDHNRAEALLMAHYARGLDAAPTIGKNK